MAKHALFLAVTTTYVLSCRRRRQERRAELEKAEQMCELMEKELRVMTVDDGEQYTSDGAGFGFGPRFAGASAVS